MSLFQLSPAFLQRQLVTSVTFKKKKYGDVWTGDVWTEGIPIQAPGAPSAAVWSCSGSEIPPFMGSFSNRRHAGIVRAQLPFLARSREAGVCLECLRAAGAGGRDEVMALAGIQGHSHSAIAASSKATFASNIWESLYCLLMAIKESPCPYLNPALQFTIGSTFQLLWMGYNLC